MALNTALTLLILLISTIIRSTFGFGDALIAMPLLTLLLGIQTAAPLFACITTTIATLILLSSWRDIDFPSAWRLILATIAGIPFGILVLKFAPEKFVVQALGIFLLLFGLYRLTGAKLPSLKNRNWAYPFGFIGGIFGSAYNINGPPVVIYGSMCSWEPEKFRATLQSYFQPTGLVILISHFFSGLWTGQVLQLYLFNLPIILVATWIGTKISQLIPTERFEKFLFVAFLLLGLLLLLSSQ